jgi:hypothetical protein
MRNTLSPQAWFLNILHAGKVPVATRSSNLNTKQPVFDVSRQRSGMLSFISSSYEEFIPLSIIQLGKLLSDIGR